jgi:orotate phosphoribosyltransferase
MILNQKTAQQTAAALLQINAIKLNPKNPFTWASGWKSPIYCDNRVALSYPEIRSRLVLALAQELQLPFIYVRPEPKKHGRKNQIEGKIEAGQKVVVIEDLISTGKSSLNAVEALREADCEVLEMLALFTYGFPQAATAFSEAKLDLTTLCDYPHLLEVAVSQEKISSTEVAKLSEWRQDPANWTP